jgi:peptidoglycan hydrolase-like protein with peptidoglycan-binding domain
MIEWIIGLGAAALGVKAVYQHYNPPLQSLTATHPVTGSKVQVVVPVKTSSMTPQPPHVITPGGISPIVVNTNQDVQKALNTLGMASPPLATDGVIGPLSKKAILAFQQQAGITQDGLVSSGLKIALGNALVQTAGVKALSTNVVAAVDLITSAQNLNLDYLPDLQHSLNVLGASPAISESGTLDAATTAAIKAF